MRKSILGLILAVMISLDALPAGTTLAAPAAGSTLAAPAVSGAAIVATALRYVGYAYTTVGNSPATGFSCIGFVSYVYQANGIPLPDDLGGAMAYAAPVAFSDLQPGDVLFFQNTVWAGLSHTAIYLGGGRFVHAEWYNRGVVTSSFTNDPVDGDYWMAHYLGANRPWGIVAQAPAASPAPAPRPSTPPSPPAPKLREGPHAKVQVSALNVRVRPSLLAPISGLTRGGTNVVVLKQYGSWDWVQLPDGAFGWVAGAALSVAGASANEDRLAGSPLPLTRAQVSGLRVHVRPNIDAGVETAIYPGQRLLVLQRWNGWARVLLSDGTRGWVSSSYLGLGTGQTAARTSQKASATTTASSTAEQSTTTSGPVLTATINLRARPSLSAGVLGLAAAGTHVRILESWGRWAYARFPSGRGGWIYSLYVQQ